MAVPSSLFIALAFALPVLSLDRCSSGPDSVALGLTSKERVALTATASRIVTALPLPEGAHVAAGDVLVTLDDGLQRAQVALAEANLAQVRAALAKLRAGARAEELDAARAEVEGAAAALAQAERTYDRDAALVASNAVTQAKLDEDGATRDQLRAALAKATAALTELENGARAEDVAMAEAEVAAAEAGLRAETRQLDDLTIRASRAGRLDSLPWNLGERVTSGSPVAVILADVPMIARVYVPEPYRVRLHEGDAVEVRVDGLETRFTGTVRWISDEPAFTPYYALNQTERSRLMYLTEVELPAEAADLPVGLPAQVVLP